MSKELNDQVMRQMALREQLEVYRAWKVPDGILTDDRRHFIVKSLAEEYAAGWLKIRDLCDQKAISEERFTPIETTYVYPPIPTREYDWWAARSGYEPGCLYGTGATELQAINDLLQAEWENT